MPSIPKALVTSLIERSHAIDKVSRRKTLTAEEAQAVSIEAIKFVRSVLSTFRKLA